MNPVNISGIDLNLLHVLKVVIEERSATRAAHKLHVTQSAVSSALRRARVMFGDALLVRRPHGLEPTPRARALLPTLQAWVTQAELILQREPVFDPATTQYTFRIACADAIAVSLLGPMLRLLDQRAPAARLRIQTLDRLLAEDGLVRGTVDLLIGVPPVVPRGCMAELVYRDPMVCVVRADHPQVGSHLSLDLFASLPHVDLALFGIVDDLVDRALAKKERGRLVQVAVPHFSSVPLVLAETLCVATLSERLAQAFAARLPLRILKPPLPLPDVEVRQVWQARTPPQPAVDFLRQVVRDAAQQSPTG